MPLKIIHVLSAEFYAGSVAYAKELAESQMQMGSEVAMVSDNEFLSDKVPSFKLAVSKRSIIQRVKNVYYLHNLIRKKNIDIVHAHSRAASWISFFACMFNKTALVSTIHGKQNIRNKLFRKNYIYGNKIIAVCKNLKEHLINEIKISDKKILVIPNLFQFDEINQNEPSLHDSEEINLTVIGRYNGPKGLMVATLLQDVFSEILSNYSFVNIRLIGNQWSEFPDFGKSSYEQLKQKYGDRLHHLGFVNGIKEYILMSDLIIGSGRVAIEATLLNKPVYAIGEACSHGILNQNNILEAIHSNFGDIISEDNDFKPDVQQIKNDLEAFLKNKGSFQYDLKNWMIQYNKNLIVNEIMKTYQSVHIKTHFKGYIPVLMYHRVLDSTIDTPHRTFLTKKNFKNHLRFFKFRGLTSITFKEYLAYSNGDIPVTSFPRKPIILTFDDGYKDNFYNMLPLTVQYGFKGVLFLLGDFHAEYNFWDQDESKEYNKLMTLEEKMKFVKMGWEIGAHTNTHPHLTELTDCNIEEELVNSRTRIENNLYTKVISLAYPYGTHDKRIRDLTKKSGYEFGISTDSGGMTIEDDRFAVFRINMFPEESLFSLYKKTSNWYRKYYQIKRKEKVLY